jgi:hypothetical protein
MEEINQMKKVQQANELQLKAHFLPHKNERGQVMVLRPTRCIGNLPV